MTQSDEALRLAQEEAQVAANWLLSISLVADADFKPMYLNAARVIDALRSEVERLRREDELARATLQEFGRQIKAEIARVEAAEALAAQREAENATLRREVERLDWLEGEMRREFNSDRPHDSLFRRNVPITRAAIDAAIDAAKEER